MKWVLISKQYELVSTYEVSDKYGVEAAKFYFMGRKQINEKRFDELWTVMSSSDPNKRWWAEDKYLDIDR